MIADQYETEEDTVWAPVMGEARVVVVVVVAVVVAVVLVVAGREPGTGASVLPNSGAR